MRQPPSPAPAPTPSPAPGTLSRRLGLPGAIVIGIGSMVGAGVFTSLGLAAASAGPLVPVALLLAGITAWINATSTAQLAAVHPTSGGAYVFGRRQLGEWAGFTAGWGFVTGKSASIAAMAYTFALYLVPVPVGAGDAAARWVAIAAVVVITGVNLAGITRTVQATVVIVVPVVLILAVVVVAGLAGVRAPGAVPDAGPLAPVGEPGPLGVLQGAGLLFFAFAGYARIATMGEEVRAPRRTIPRSVFGALGFTLVLYGLLALSLLAVLGVEGVAGSPTAVRDAVEAMFGPGWAWLAVLGAALACLGSMLNLVAGISRTGLAMAREGDLPRPLARISARTSVPWVAQLAAAAVVVVLLLATDVLTVVGISSFGVLVYYAVANVSASTLTDRVVPGPRWLNLAGAVACVLLACTLPTASVLTMLAVFAAGLAGRALVRARHRRR